MKKTYCTLFILLLLAVPALAGMEMPETFKGIVTLYPNAKIIQTANMEGTSMAVFEVADGMEKVGDYYKAEIKKINWTIVMELKQEKEFSMVAQKDAKTLTIHFAGDADGKNSVSMTINSGN
ncbi:MAG: hypothetical protein R2941_08795 [Desulfobacterales bacterium]